MERKNLFEIIKKNVENFKNLTKNSKSHDIKEIKEKLDLYITSIEQDKNISINPSKINHIKYYNNFSNNKSIVPNRDTKVFYVQSREKEKGKKFKEKLFKTININDKEEKIKENNKLDKKMN